MHTFSAHFAALFVGATLITQPAFAQATPCTPRALVTAGWPSDSGSRFSLRLPPGLTRRPLKGVDSEVGRWANDVDELVYDFGSYSDTLGGQTETSGTVCAAPVGGRRARVVVFRDQRGRYSFGVHRTGFQATSLGPVSLTIVGYARDSLGRDSLVAGVWSLTFRNR